MRHRKIDDNQLLEMIREGKQGQECASYFGCSPAAISKRLRRLQPPPKSLEVLTLKEQRFCIEVANGRTRTQAAANSFECGSLQSAKVIGSQLMDKPEIEMAIHDLMAEAGLTKRYRLQRLKQHVDSKSPDISLKGLDMSFRLDSSYAPEKHLHGIFDISVVDQRRREIAAEIAEIDQRLIELEGSENV